MDELLLAAHEGEVVERSFEGCDLSGQDLERLELTACTLSHCSLAGARIGRIDLSQCELVECDLAGLVARRGYWGRTQLRDCRATGADLSESYFRDTRFIGGNFAYLNLSYGKLERVAFEDVRLSEAILSSVRLVGGLGLSNCDLSAAECIGTRLRNVDLSSCEIAGLRVGDRFAELQGARIAYDQAIDLVGLLGVRITDAS
ncbi:MAG: pentapeptide repeat-containing protein [Coriobacteriales bacterium]|nr:pentapeptide repeat-containing protein [Coriobacteriales bacterium]